MEEGAALLEKTVSGVPLSKEQFRIPPKELGIMPFWFWNGNLDYDEMEYQLKELHSKGIPGFFIHSRFGLTVPYLSDEWFKRVQFTIDKARELDMQVWIYDEKNWPSGTVGWEIPTLYPDLQQRYLELVVMDFHGPFFTYLEGTDSRYLDLEDSEPIFACGVRAEEFESGQIREVIDVTPNLSFDKIIPWEAPEGRWKLLYFVERRAKWYIDALNPESTRKFIEKTHEQYKKWVGKDFGDLVPGFYTDEPALHYFEVGKDNYIIPWSKRMFKIFREANGYDLKPYLPALFAGMGEKTTKVRYDFYNTINQTYAEAFYGQIREWCEENDVLHTGHLLYEEYLRLQSRCEGNLFNLLKELHIIGVDHLYPRIGNEERAEEHVALKLGSSAAHHFGSTRLLCESLGGTYWDCTMERMKWIADWEYVLGVNLFNPHGFHYSIEGERKRDWPPSQFYHHPWWKQYGLFNDYLTRNGYMLSGGRHVAKVAMLFPMTSMWATYVPQAPTPENHIIEAEFNYLTDALLRVHFDYDYVDEDVLAGAEIKDGKIVVRDEEYSVLLLPPLTTIKETTMDQIEKFVAAGGHVIGDIMLPTESPAGLDHSIVQRLEKIFGVNPIEIREQWLADQKGQPRVSTVEHENGSKAILVTGGGFGASGSLDLLDEVLRQSITPDVEIDDPNVFYLHRVKDGKDVYFFVNPTWEERTITISLEGEGSVEYWKQETGEILPVCVYEIADGRTTFQITLTEIGSGIYVLNKGDNKLHVHKSNTIVDQITETHVSGYSRGEEDARIQLSTGETKELDNIPAGAEVLLDGPWDFAVDADNAHLTASFQVFVDEENIGLEQGFHKPEYDDSDWMTFIQGAWELQLPHERDEEVYPETVWYRCSFQADYIPENLRVLIDGCKGDSTFFINGVEATGERRRCKFDAQIQEMDISELCQEGTNTIAIRLVVHEKVAGMLDPLKIVGDFSLAKTNDGWVLRKPVTQMQLGSWTEQGYPYFAGTGTYTKVFDLPEHFAGKRVFIQIDCGDDVAEIDINGVRAGTMLWHPYTVEITDQLQPGSNEVKIHVTNTLINFLEGVERPGGLFAVPRLTPYSVYHFEL